MTILDKGLENGDFDIGAGEALGVAEPIRSSECLQPCPYDNDVHYCALNNGHSGPHRCSRGHSWG